ncbi:MAG: hypothetical protein LDL53_09755 [Candidatus Hydrogenedens sp.]|nr:hypothetical protein [Candidatus Hydrogenedens sp.]
MQLSFFLLFAITFSQTADNEILTQNATLNNESMLFCWKIVQGWMQFSDPEVYLFPRNLKSDFYWNAKDCSADNYPFLTLTAYLTDRYLFETRMKSILKMEQKLCNRIDRLPDDWDLIQRNFRTPTPELPSLIFGSAEYIKDGLLPLTEWLGPSEWSQRMLDLMDDIWKNAKIKTEVGLLPDTSHEVAGDVLQGLSRMYWLTGNDKYKEQALQLADYFFIHHSPVETDYFQLDDHGCEIFGGLSEAYLISKYKAPEKHEQWKEPMHNIIRKILEIGRNDYGLFYEAINPKEKKVLRQTLTDNWGYNYNAIATVAMIDDMPDYIREIQRTLDNLWEARDYPWENDIADGLADSLEGAINLINRFPSSQAERWADYTAQRLLKKQKPSGIIEGWHGDGNSARTMLMYAFWKSQGCYVEPWHADIGVGAIRQAHNQIKVVVKTEWRYLGKLKCDLPRHKEYFHLPIDYPRLNQFPEWFTVEKERKYQVIVNDKEPIEMDGTELREGIALDLPANGVAVITITVL